MFKKIKKLRSIYMPFIVKTTSVFSFWGFFFGSFLLKMNKINKKAFKNMLMRYGEHEFACATWMKNRPIIIIHKWGFKTGAVFLRWIFPNKTCIG